MNWNYTSTINRMGEETKVLSNESIDVPSHENSLTPILVIRNSEEPDSKFSIKINFGGVELKGNSTKVNCVYEKTCYRKCCGCYSSCNCYIRKYVITTASSKFRIRFDNDKPLTLETEYGVSIITLPNEFMEQMKGKNKMTIEIDDKENGKLCYDFNIEHLQGMCEENKIYKFRTPTQKAIDDVVCTTPTYYQVSTQKSYLPHAIIALLVFLCFVIWICATNKENITTSQVIPPSDSYVDTSDTFVSSTDYKNQELKNIEKKEPIKKERKKIVKEENEDNKEYVYPYSTEAKTTTTYNYVYPYSTEAKTTTTYNDVVLSKEDNVTPTKEEPIQITNSLNVNDYPTYQVKKKGLLKRLFSKN